MSNERDVLVASYEAEFGKKPRKNMKTATIKKKLAEATEKVELPTELPIKKAEPTPAISDKLQELLETVTENAKDEKPVMIAIIAEEGGVHMSLAGEPEEVAIMVTTAMASRPLMAAIFNNSAMMYQMNMQQKQQLAEANNTEANLSVVKPKTEA